MTMQAVKTIDHSDSARTTGTLTLIARNPRRPYQLGKPGGVFTSPTNAPVHPLVSVDGRPVSLGLGLRTRVTVAAGPHLVEVMDDHHYESRTVTVDEDATATLWFGVGLLRSEPRIYIGSQEYAAASIKVDRRAEQVGAAASVVAFIAGLATLLPWLTDIDAVPEHVPMMSVIAFAVAVFWPVRALARALLRLRGPVDVGAPEPEPVATSTDPAHKVMLTPRGAVLPPAKAAICLRFRADPKALASIRIRDRVGNTSRKRRMPYFSNSRVDWLAAPEVTANGQPLPPRWGTWWIPVRPGPVRLQVRLPGFTDGERRGPSATAELQLSVEAGQVRHVECRYNIVELAAERLRERPDAEAQWQRVLRGYRRLDRAVRRARAPRLALMALGTERIDAESRLRR